MPSQPTIIAPSLLAGNHAALAESVALVERHDLPWVHIDVMDGHFVPNLSFGPRTLHDLRETSKLYFDTHLMLSEPHRYVDIFADAGAQGITIHIEPDFPCLETLRHIRGLGLVPGIALNPETSAERVRPLLGEVGLVLAMTVHPGFGGQHFIRSVIRKIQTLREWRDAENFHYRIEVDGGITAETGLDCLWAGADTLVTGTSFFKAADKPAFIGQLLAHRLPSSVLDAG
jgi:ribulose-phosphate 3-epimerase